MAFRSRPRQRRPSYNLQDVTFFGRRTYLDRTAEQTRLGLQNALDIEEDRRYAERLVHSWQDDELQITQDHQLAMQLARGRSASPRRDNQRELARQRSPERGFLPPPPMLNRARQRAREDSTLADELLGPTTIDTRTRIEEEIEDTEPELEVLEDTATGTCVICTDDTTSRTSVLISCEHRMCRGCLRRLFRGAMTDETLFPPRCCQTHEIDADAARAVLGHRFPAGYDQRALELRTVDRTYCHVQQCSAFIPPTDITHEVAVCHTCYGLTCPHCKQAAHANGECPEDPAQQQLEAMAQREGWRRCNDCRAMVELNYGCNHMTCRCGAQFCYVCGVAWRNCHCPQFTEDRLYQRAEEVANRPRNRPLRLQIRDHVPQIPAGPQNPEDIVRAMHQCQRQAVDAIRARLDARHGNPVPYAPPPRRRGAAAIERANILTADLNRTQMAHRQAREAADQARARRFANADDHVMNVDDIAAHLRENHECAHEGRWRRFHAGVNRCEICQRVKANPAVGECPTCFLQACYYCQKHRMRPGE